MITTHVLDTARGVPAEGVGVRLEKALPEGRWSRIAEGRTKADGRVSDLLPQGAKLERGVYRLAFETAEYFRSLKVKGFYPAVEVTFEVTDERHHHIPLLLSPYGYSTYRGS